jgi:copper(I)-binding protein
MPRPTVSTAARSVLPGAAAIAAIAMLLAGCVGTPAIDTPAVTVPTFTGIAATSTDHSVAVRDLHIPDPGPAGYPAGAMVPLLVQVWNNTNAPVSLTSATITGGTPAALIDPKATAPAAVFDLPVPAGSSVALSQGSGLFLRIQCAKLALTAGTNVPMTFVFSNGATIAIDVPIGRFPDPATTTPPVTAC